MSVTARHPGAGPAPLPASPRKRGEETVLRSTSLAWEEETVRRSISSRTQGAETGIHSISLAWMETTRIRSASCRRGEEASLHSISRKRGKTGAGVPPREHGQARLRSLPRGAEEGWGGGAPAAAMPAARSAP